MKKLNIYYANLLSMKNKDLKFALWSKYALLGVIMFIVLFALRGSCDRESELCQGGFPFKWLFRDGEGVFTNWSAFFSNLIVYYMFTALLLFSMRKYANYKDNKKK